MKKWTGSLQNGGGWEMLSLDSVLMGINVTRCPFLGAVVDLSTYQYRFSLPNFKPGIWRLHFSV